MLLTRHGVGLHGTVATLLADRHEAVPRRTAGASTSGTQLESAPRPSVILRTAGLLTSLRNVTCAVLAEPYSVLATSESDAGLAAAAPPIPSDATSEVAAAAQQLPARLYQPSDEFMALCHNQLKLLSKLLHPRNGVGELRSAAYARTAASMEAGSLQLVRVAASGPATPYANGRAAVEVGCGDDDAVLVLGGGSGGSVDDAVAEESLVGERLLVLPDNGAVVVPLAHGRLLVGLLVVERALPLQGDGSGAWVPGSDGGDGWLVLGDGGRGSVDVSMEEGGMGVGGDDDERAARGSSGPLGPLFSPGDEGVLTMVAQSLALACALDARAALEGAHHVAGRASLQGLVAQVSSPLRTLRTLGAMLGPRLGTTGAGDAEETQDVADMVDGMMAQGHRLQEVVSQLAAALHPWAHPNHRLSPQHEPMPSSSLAPASALTPQLPARTDGARIAPHAPAMVPPEAVLTRSGPGAAAAVVRECARTGAAAAVIAEPPPPRLSRTHKGSDVRLLTRLDSWLNDDEREAEGGCGRLWEASGGCNVSDLLMPLCRAAMRLADATGVVLRVYPPLRASGGIATALTQVQVEGAPVLLPRPARPLIAGVPPQVLYGAVSQLLDGALQRTPRGGSVHVSARPLPGAGGIVISITDGGATQAHRLAQQLRRAMTTRQTPSAEVPAQRAQQAAGEDPAAHSKGEDSGALRTLMRGEKLGSAVVGLAVAQQTIEQVGGSVTVRPLDGGMGGGGTGEDGGEGVCIELWVPAKMWGD